MVIVQIPEQFDSRHKAWAKHVTHVDRNKSTGYAFTGRFLDMGGKADLPVNALVLVYDERGSMKNWDAHVDVYRVSEAGTLEPTGVSAQVHLGKTWALEVRDAIAALLDAGKE